MNRLSEITRQQRQSAFMKEVSERASGLQEPWYCSPCTFAAVYTRFNDIELENTYEFIFMEVSSA
jgi:hypothetical protein